ncbi:RodZ family helix-turn-helix domain-containing protein [Paraburkholderia acidisoli]|uniref:Uncharacterized protein n=1 Tax=Paraburkholderia acidisoli TaxID=2571748 RepID=A0A7Z2GGC6_9BURK|nr:hypothetical protein [Paraburkholderia acidisoli]QGZ60925.1 hypothetical protein FAZ98_03780 [Paraburkholderia acidisoli]
MRHPALRRSARYSGKRGPRDSSANPNANSSAPLPPDPQGHAESAGAAFQNGGAGAVTGDARGEPTSSASADPAAQNRPAPGVPPDGEHNQGGARAEGIDYQRDLGSEQDA